MIIRGENYFSSLRLTFLYTSFFLFFPLSSSLQVSSVPQYCKPYLHSQPGGSPRESRSCPVCCLDKDKRCFVQWDSAGSLKFWLSLSSSYTGYYFFSPPISLYLSLLFILSPTMNLACKCGHRLICLYLRVTKCITKLSKT